jgi:hypothetical protein
MPLTARDLYVFEKLCNCMTLTREMHLEVKLLSGTKSFFNNGTRIILVTDIYKRKAILRYGSYDENVTIEGFNSQSFIASNIGVYIEIYIYIVYISIYKVLKCMC